MRRIVEQKDIKLIRSCHSSLVDCHPLLCQLYATYCAVRTFRRIPGASDSGKNHAERYWCTARFRRLYLLFSDPNIARWAVRGGTRICRLLPSSSSNVPAAIPSASCSI